MNTQTLLGLTLLIVGAFLARSIYLLGVRAGLEIARRIAAEVNANLIAAAAREPKP